MTLDERYAAAAAKEARKAPKAATITESQFQRQVIELAQLLGWRVAAFRPALNARGQWRTAVQGDGAGWPDLVLVRDRVLFRELKRDGAYLEPRQKVWRDQLVAAGADWGVWRPRDFDRIQAELK